jgi:hypothetical protein
MKINRLCLVTAALVVTALPLFADDTNTNNTPALSYEQPEIYRANEFSIDAFGTASESEYTLEHLGGSTPRSVHKNTQWGAGAGVNYFATHYLGIGGEGYWQDDHDQPFVHSASGNLLLRLPLGQSGFAPYAMGGGGRQFDGGRYSFGQAGGGIEYRFCAHLGFFIDARMVWPNETKMYGVARAGLRFTF